MKKNAVQRIFLFTNDLKWGMMFISNGENIMNKYTHDIAKLLKVDLETAEKVQYEMECWGLDFSECSKREFNEVARECFELV